MSVFLARSDGKAIERGEDTLHDAYLSEVHFIDHFTYTVAIFSYSQKAIVYICPLGIRTMESKMAAVL